MSTDAGGHADVGADGMFEKAKEKGTISSMPKIQGIAVWQKGHIGIYVGDGKVIEAANTRAGILETRAVCGNMDALAESAGRQV